MYDLIIIGGGIAGYSAAQLSANNGFNTLLIDKYNIGGSHIHRGNIPLKYMLENTESEKSLETQISDDHPHFSKSYSSIVKLKDERVRNLSRELNDRLIAKNVTIVKGKAKIIGESYHGYVVQCHKEDYTSKRLLIATGSVPFIPTIPGVKKATYSGFVLSSDNVLEINNIPKDLVVIGGGFIGLEMASYFNDLGCHVTIVEKRDKLAEMLDSSLSNAIVDSYEHQGIHIILNAEVVEIESQKVHYVQKGIRKTIDCERALLSIGRVPYHEELGLETLGIRTQNGIIVNEFGQTSVKNVYAAGDVTRSSVYESKAQNEAEKCVLNLLGRNIKLEYSQVPIILKTKPEIGFIGESEESAKAKKIQTKSVFVRALQTIKSGNKVIEFEGFCKIIINQANDKIIGIHIFDHKGESRIKKMYKSFDTVFELDKIEEMYL